MKNAIWTTLLLLILVGGYVAHFHYLYAKYERLDYDLNKCPLFSTMILAYEYDHNKFPSDPQEIRDYLELYDDYYNGFYCFEYLKNNDFNLLNNREDSIYYIYINGFDHMDNELHFVHNRSNIRLIDHMFRRADMIMSSFSYDNRSLSNRGSFPIRQKDPHWDGD